jgi:hypothetical protein
LKTRVEQFLTQEQVLVARERPGRAPVSIDLRSGVTALAAESANALSFTLRAGEGEATARPGELLAHLLGPALAQPGALRIVREAVIFGEPVRVGGPLGLRLDRA